jgi:2-amino-4-hydroxy-6-hydroxymethyldihydropteridine diphosphokinase
MPGKELKPMPKDQTAFLSMGTNLGDRLLYLREGLRYLERHEAVELEAISSVYETDPVGFTEQPAFLNIAVRLKTTLTPMELLHLCQETENHFQRDRSVHWGPRTLDIDLLTYDDLILDSPELVLPHPRMTERDFVQIPLRELATGEVGCSANVRPLYSHWYIR